MMDCTMDTPDCSSGIQSGSVSSWPPATPTSSSSTSFNEYPPQAACLLPPPPSPPYQSIYISQPQPNSQPLHVSQAQLTQQPPQQAIHINQAPFTQPPQLPDMVPSKVVEEFEKIMRNENDKVVLTNSVCLLFRFSIDSVRGAEVCQSMAHSSEIMSCLHYVLTNEQFKDDDLILCYATGNLTNLSKYEEGRTAILWNYNGVNSLLCSLKSRDSNVVIFAITAIHNLLLDRRVGHQEKAKDQVMIGIEHIVKLLENEFLLQNYEFKVIVLDCLQILAYGDSKNRLAIRKSGGPSLLLRTMRENLANQPTDDLIDTASRVLKSLSVCSENKEDIIENGGVIILTDCIGRNNVEILKTCLWTLRNLSDVINKSKRYHGECLKLLVERLLDILRRYADHPNIVTCAIGILANLTCNNESIKQLICDHHGVDLILDTIANAMKDEVGRQIEILEPAICALCHLLNQGHNLGAADEAREAVIRFGLFDRLQDPRLISYDLAKAVDKLVNLTYDTARRSC